MKKFNLFLTQWENASLRPCPPLSQTKRNATQKGSEGSGVDEIGQRLHTHKKKILISC